MGEELEFITCSGDKQPVPLFPHDDKIKIGTHAITAHQVIEVMGQMLTPERQARIRHVVEGRTYSVAPVLENIYDRGNTSAVMRSAEAMGFQGIHVIEPGEKFKKANRVTQGADKWLDVLTYKTTGECVTSLKARGYRIYATHLDARAKPIDELDFSGPVAWVLGNEKDGISAEMIELCDATAVIPMDGFVQSFNISVAGAISFYHIHRERQRLFGRSGDLNEVQKQILTAHYFMRTSDNADAVLAKALGLSTRSLAFK